MAGSLGAFFSFLGNNLPTGPFMVLGASGLFLVAFLFGPRHGLVVRTWRQHSRTQRFQRENSLKSIYHVLEGREFRGEGVSLHELAERRRETLEEARRRGLELKRNGLVTLHEEGNMIYLTPEGWQRACSIVRNHRLWELYLTNAAQISADHVHDDAEKIEHVLGEEVVRQLERRLDYATKDPHGRAIPSLSDQRKGSAPAGRTSSPVGYGKQHE
jgi:manganese/zinc/iron transport system permease protein